MYQRVIRYRQFFDLKLNIVFLSRIWVFKIHNKYETNFFAWVEKKSKKEANAIKKICFPIGDLITHINPF